MSPISTEMPWLNERPETSLISICDVTKRYLLIFFLLSNRIGNFDWDWHRNDPRVTFMMMQYVSLYLETNEEKKKQSDTFPMQEKRARTYHVSGPASTKAKRLEIEVECSVRRRPMYLWSNHCCAASTATPQNANWKTLPQSEFKFSFLKNDISCKSTACDYKWLRSYDTNPNIFQ